MTVLATSGGAGLALGTRSQLFDSQHEHEVTGTLGTTIDTAMVFARAPGGAMALVTPHDVQRRCQFQWSQGI